MVKMAKSSLLLTTLVSSLLLGSLGAQSQQEEQEDYFKKWLQEDVIYTITEEEKDVFNKLVHALPVSVIDSLIHLIEEPHDPSLNALRRHQLAALPSLIGASVATGTLGVKRVIQCRVYAAPFSALNSEEVLN